MRGLWRIPERTLLILAAIGGSAGAFAGQSLLRHKTQKQPLKSYLIGIAVLQVIAITGLGITSGGALLGLVLV